MLRTNLSVSFATFGALLIACGSDAGDETSTSSSSGSSSGSLGASSSSSGGASSGGASSGGASSGGASSGGTSSSSGSTSSSSGAASSSGASSSGDAGTDTCGARRCAGSETCVDDACVLVDCQGVQVPGDYATVQAAVTAMAATGGTICVAPGVYAEDVRFEGAHGLVVQGRSAELTTLRSVQGNADATGLTLRGLGVQQASRLSNGGLTLEYCAFRADNGVAFDASSGAGETISLTVRHSRFSSPAGTALRVQSSFQVVDAVLDGVDVSGETAIAFGPNDTTGGSLLLQNSYVHDAAQGLVADMYKGTLTIFSSTFVDAAKAIETHGYPISSSAPVWHNVLITGSDVAVSLHKASASQSHNALYGNTTNYAEAATPGDAFVTQDCLLDESTPPRLGPGSPCRAAGTADYATQHDFFGADRGAPPSIGAVD